MTISAGTYCRRIVGKLEVECTRISVDSVEGVPDPPIVTLLNCPSLGMTLCSLVLLYLSATVVLSGPFQSWRNEYSFVARIFIFIVKKSNLLQREGNIRRKCIIIKILNFVIKRGFFVDLVITQLCREEVSENF